MAATAGLILFFSAAFAVQCRVTAEPIYRVTEDVPYNTVSDGPNHVFKDGEPPSRAFDAEKFLGLREDIWSLREEVTNMQKQIDNMKHSTFGSMDYDSPQKAVTEEARRRYAERKSPPQAIPVKCEGTEDGQTHTEVVKFSESVGDHEALIQLIPSVEVTKVLRALVALLIRQLTDIQSILGDDGTVPAYQIA